MNEKILVCVITLSLIFSGCISTQSNQTVQNQNIQNQEWISNTTDLIEKSRGIDGGYSDFPPQRPTLYSTYYFLSSLEILDKEPKYKEETINWLFSKEREILRNESSPNMDDIYFLTMSLELLETQPKNGSELEVKVMSLQNPDGSFASGALLDTFRALQILNVLGTDLDGIPKTKSWLVGKWKNINESKNLLSDSSLLISALKFYGVNVLSSEKYAQKNNWIVEQRKFVEAELESLPENEIDLISLGSFTEFLLITGDISPNIKTNLENYLTSKQLPNGGYNVFYDTYGESQGTYLALVISSDVGMELNDTISEFIYDHEIIYQTGGFRPSYRLISSTENTYLAVQSLNILHQEPSNKEEIYGYLESQLKSDDTESSDIFYSVATLRMLSQEPTEKDNLREWIALKINYIANKPTEKIDPEDIVNLMYLTKAASDLDMNLNNKEVLIQKVQSFQNDDGGFGLDNSDIYMTYYIVTTLKELGADPKNKDLCESWIKEGQAEDGGFIARRGEFFTNSSDIYSTYISILSLNALEANPDNPEKLLMWLEDCKVETGGFSITTEYADLDTTMSPSESSLETTSWGLMIWDYTFNDR
ncbi:prenyltransferase/squalene oxidase repeat-containing protein [Methanohalophilus sp.]